MSELIAQKRFREDLYFHINVIPICLPPLRRRKDDIPLLVNTFIKRLALRTGKPINGLTREALNRFMDYPWPGNVREMKNALEYAFTITGKETIDIDHLPHQMLFEASPPVPLSQSSVGGYKDSERQQLLKALRAADSNQSKTARRLGINRVTVWNRMRKYGINLKREIN